ncbi:RNA-guided endonuclease TnpB family protein [Shouchella clausii]|uniref:RNA-guided endonuclease TnpB family protein n=1 Tax=Shouchella clausii TaxID=79880 RepID=UPI000B9704B9|nr:RNA-guided endonuclease TnpB family protein [Shouchella clausii]AST96233.1 transposase [Shouchella clausii]MCR1288635.1 transposase [Shouchella clausii]MEB5473494.1 RNA-guided endonuclease TnpB family protein [Shouchella clausii]QNM42592.1 transposase [Shouchella clausii]WQG94557.1 RNA-guided endonuclease TnpB family protein [Shouchella clausii]
MAKRNKAYKFRLYPTDEQALLIRKTFGCVRFVYNKMLAEREETYALRKEDKDVLKKVKPPTPAKYKKEYEWLKEVDSLALANAQLNLDKAYKAFFKGNAKFPTFKRKRHKQSYTTNIVNGNIQLLGRHIKLPKVKMVKIRQHREIPADHKIKSCTISMTSSGKYYISILTEYEKEIESKEIKKVVGLDFAMNGLFVDSEGKKANYPRFYRQMLDRLAKEQRKLSRKKKGSSNWHKQRIRVANIHEKVANQRRNFLHHQSKELVANFDAVVIEDLNMKGRSQALKFGKSVVDNGWGMFTSFLKYKLNEQGKQLIKIDKWFPSTKTCSSCGSVREITLSERTYQCTCGLTLDRDYNSALNIKKEGIRLLATA